MKAVILARVSTLRQEQEGLSLKEMQLPTLREYAKSKGFEVADEFVFQESAADKIRNKFNEMVDYVKQHPDIKKIIAYRVDRITRNFRDHHEADVLMKEYGIEFHFVQDRLIINKETTGRDITDWDTKVYLGKQYINRLREDGINTANYKLRNGEFPGWAPFGYMNVVLDRKKKWIQPDKTKSVIVQYLFETYATGNVSILGLSKKAQKEYGVKVPKSTVERILKSKFYHGIMTYKGKEYPHAYETLVSEELYKMVQDQMKAASTQKVGATHKSGGLEFMYKGLIKCADCGCSITPDRKKGKYIYYKCTGHRGDHGAKYIKEEELTKQFQEIYKSIKVPEWVVQEMTGTLKESHQSKVKFHREQLNSLSAEQRKYSHRLEKLYEDRLDGIISDDIYYRRFDDYKARLEQIKIKLECLDGAEQEYYETAIMLLNVASKAEELFESSKIDERKLFINITLSNLKLKGSNLVYDWVRPFDSMLVSTNHPKWLPGWDSNLRPIG